MTKNTPKKKVNEVINFIEERPESFNWSTLEDKIKKLSIEEFSELLGKVETVCQQWATLRVAPKGDIGIIAAYQGAKSIMERNLPK